MTWKNENVLLPSLHAVQGQYPSPRTPCTYGTCCSGNKQVRKGDTHPVLVTLEQPVHVVGVSPGLVVRTRDVQEVAPDLGEEAAVGDLERPGVPVCWLAGCDLVRLALRGGVTDT